MVAEFASSPQPRLKESWGFVEAGVSAQRHADGANFLVDHRSLRAAHGLDDAVLGDVRAVGGLLSARVPQLIEDFYCWLSRLPEFGQFLPNERLLSHVKRQQAEYWRDFLRRLGDVVVGTSCGARA